MSNPRSDAIYVTLGMNMFLKETTELLFFNQKISLFRVV